MIRVIGAAVLGVFGARRFAFMAAGLLGRRSAAPEYRAPSLTVVMPARNEAAAIARSLERLASAECPAERFSVLLVDDGSADSTGEIMERFASAREGWSVIRARGEGKASALNAALAGCSDAELVAVCDADVRLDPGCLRELVSAFADPARAPSAGSCGPRTRPPRPWPGIAPSSCGSTS